MDRPRVFQVHATLRGELVAMRQREEPSDFRECELALREVRDAVIADAIAKGGYDDLVVHTEKSSGFLWMATDDVEGDAS